jgi:transcriptional regulator with XRE-family HTH domain
MAAENKILLKFGARLKKLRQERGLSQRELSQNCAIDHSKIGKMERGLINPTLVTIVELAKGLNVHPSELLQFDLTSK